MSPQNISCDFCHWSSLIFTIPDFWNLWSHRMLLWSPPGSTFHGAQNFSSYAATCWPTKKLLWPARGSTSRCSQHYVHICYTQNHKKQLKDLHQSWTAYVFVLCALMHFRSNTAIIISLFGTLNFVGAFKLFIFLIFPMEILTFCSIHDFLIS